MPELLFQFSWRVWKSGHEVTTGQLAGPDGKWLASEKILVHKPETTGGHPTRVYFPLEEHTGLFKDFAELELNEQSVCSFANKYGFLIMGMPLRDGGDGESLGAVWYDQIERMKRAVNLWELAKKRDRESLKNYFTWSGTETIRRVEYKFKHGGTLHSAWFDAETSPDVFERLTPGDSVQLAEPCF
jgi:hypothetical protein